jgi:hypothetical protein
MPFCLAPLAYGFSLVAVFSATGQPQPIHNNLASNPALEQFKSLAGDWDGKDSRGNPVHASYEALASGVVMERLQTEGHPAMITMYSLDGDHIMAIHFCSEGNQPIMKTGPISAATGKYDFQIERAYGLRSPDDIHMVELLVTLADSDHLSQAWTNLDHGKRSTNTISFTRKK